MNKQTNTLENNQFIENKHTSKQIITLAKQTNTATNQPKEDTSKHTSN